MREIDEHWSLEDIWEAIDAIGVFAEAQMIHAEAAKEDAEK